MFFFNDNHLTHKSACYSKNCQSFSVGKMIVELPCEKLTRWFEQLIYIYIHHIYIYRCVYVCMYIEINTVIWSSSYTYIYTSYIHIYIYVYGCVYTYICIEIHTVISSSSYTYIYTSYAYTYIEMCIYIYIHKN